MSVSFRAIIGHKFDTAAVNHMFSVIETVSFSSLDEMVKLIHTNAQEPTSTSIADKQRFHKSWKWKLYSNLSTQVAGEDFITFNCPDCSLIWGRRSFIVDPETIWTCFLTDSAIRAKLRKVCHDLAYSFGKYWAIYLPDSGYKVSAACDLVFDGKSIEEIEEWLLQQHGLSSQTIETIYKKTKMLLNGQEIDVGNEEGYFIDKFEDISLVQDL